MSSKSRMAKIAISQEQNVIDDKQILASFGLLDPFITLPRIIKKEMPTVSYKKEPLKRPATTDDGLDSVFVAVRKSARVMAKSDVLKSDSVVTSPTSEPQKTSDATVVCQTVNATDASLTVDQVVPAVVVRPTVVPKSYGPIPEFDVGTIWKRKLDCIYAGIHRTMGAICGGSDGAYSICLSETPEDDVDLGVCFTYTVPGCRKSKGGKSKSKTKSKKVNLQKASEELIEKEPVLSANLSNGNQVRVIRGYKYKSPFAPLSGYRYDGVYTVEKKWFTTGLSGDKLWKFALKRCDNQTPPPWQFTSSDVISDPNVTKPTSEPQKTPAATIVCQTLNATDASLTVDQVVPAVVVKPTVITDFYGPMPEFDVGTIWKTKLDCIYAGIHRTTRAICGGSDGAYSICLSVTPEDDVDLGLCFTYTVPGCRKSKGGKSKKTPEELKEKDPVLSQNLSNGNQVRVIRSYRSKSPFAPKSGYRYDGVYTVEKQWFTAALSGDKLWKFALKRCDNQTPPPWQFTSETEVYLDSTAVDGSDGTSSPGAVSLLV